MSKGHIERQLPNRHPGFPEEGGYTSLAMMQAVFGKHLVELTPAIARRLMGKTVFVVDGQGWWDVGRNESKAGRMGRVSRLKIIGENPELAGYIIVEDPKIPGFHFEASADEDDEVLGVGGGSDPIHVFLK